MRLTGNSAINYAKNLFQREPLTTIFSTQQQPGDEVELPAHLPVRAQALPKLEESQAMMELKASSLKRPVLMVHGLAQDAGSTWANMKNFFLTNPENHYGGNFSASNENDFLLKLRDQQGANVFAIDLTDNLAAPSQMACEVTRALHWIHQATGSDVDVITHSMGALTARAALNQGGGQHMHSLTMIAPPNRGAYLSNMAGTLDQLKLYSNYPKESWGAMKALEVERDVLGRPANQWLHQLNQDWNQDRTQLAHSTIITGSGVPTADQFPNSMSSGDGMVAAHRANLGEETPLYVAVPSNIQAGEKNFRDFQYLFYNHLSIASSPEVFAKIDELLAQDPPKQPARPASGPEQLTFEGLMPGLESWTKAAASLPKHSPVQQELF